MSSPLRDRLRAQMKAAMLAKDSVTLNATRSALAALDNAEAVPTEASAGALEASPVAGSVEAPRRELTPDDEHRIVRGEIIDLAAAADQIAEADPERANDHRAAADTLTRILDED
ncbi:hypothetical protein ACMYYO_13900 [Dermacoccaceae bacterium W4C1]